MTSGNNVPSVRRQYPSLRDFVDARLAARGWTVNSLARRIAEIRTASDGEYHDPRGIEGTVRKWLYDPRDKNYRRPQLAGCQELATALHAPLELIMLYAGHEYVGATTTVHDNATDMQQQAIGIIYTLPDDMLSVVLPQLYAVADEQLKRSIAAAQEDEDA